MAKLIFTVAAVSCFGVAIAFVFFPHLGIRRTCNAVLAQWGVLESDLDLGRSELLDCSHVGGF